MIIELVPSLIFIVFLLFLSGFFSGAETALFSLNKIERKRIAGGHPLIGDTVNDLLNRPRRTLITILIGNMIVNTLATVVVTHIAIQLFGNIGVGYTIAVFTCVLLLFGEIVPKVFAIRNNILISEMSAVTLNIIAKIIFPLRFIVRRISDFILGFLVLGVKSKVDLMSEDELKALVRIGEEEGVLKKGEVRMITRLIELGERPVKQIMTPRTEFVAFNLEDGPEPLRGLIRKSHFTYIPVYEGKLDNFLGVISTQDFMLSSEEDVRKFILVSEYVPETKCIDDLLLEFKLKSHKFAVCVDEYGSISGLVTFEDILEEIFGEFHDEYAQVESPAKEIRQGEFLVQAKITLHTLHETLGIHLESDSSETLNGWLLEKFGRIPAYNESMIYKGIQFQIAEVHKNRIAKVYIRKKT